MKKIFSTAGLTLLIGLALSGCTSATEVAPVNGSTESPPPVAKPMFDETQHKNLVSELTKIDPVLGEERSVVATQKVCRIILRSEPESVQIDAARTIVRHTEIQPGPPTDDAAKKIIEVINTNGFCKDAE